VKRKRGLKRSNSLIIKIEIRYKIYENRNSKILLPIKSSFNPLVDKAKSKNNKENNHGEVAKEWNFIESKSPREEIHNFKIKDDEEDTNKIESNIEFVPSIRERIEATLIC